MGTEKEKGKEKQGAREKGNEREQEVDETWRQAREAGTSVDKGKRREEAASPRSFESFEGPRPPLKRSRDDDGDVPDNKCVLSPIHPTSSLTT